MGESNFRIIRKEKGGKFEMKRYFISFICEGGRGNTVHEIKSSIIRKLEKEIEEKAKKIKLQININ